MKRSFSSLFDHSTRPLRSQYKMRIRSRRELLKTYNAAANTSRFKLCSTRSASEAACLRKSIGATHRYTTAAAVGRIMRLAQAHRSLAQVGQPRQTPAPPADRSSTPAVPASIQPGPRSPTLVQIVLANFPCYASPPARPAPRSTDRHGAKSASIDMLRPRRNPRVAHIPPWIRQSSPIPANAQATSHLSSLVLAVSTSRTPEVYVQVTCHQESEKLDRVWLPNRLRRNSRRGAIVLTRLENRWSLRNRDTLDRLID